MTIRPFDSHWNEIVKKSKKSKPVTDPSRQLEITVPSSVIWRVQVPCSAGTGGGKPHVGHHVGDCDEDELNAKYNVQKLVDDLEIVITAVSRIIATRMIASAKSLYRPFRDYCILRQIFLRSVLTWCHSVVVLFRKEKRINTQLHRL